MNYARSLRECMRKKTVRHKPYGLMKFLPIPQRPWSSISMDFIEGLPLSLDFDSILVIVDRLTKYAIFIECHKTDGAIELAMLFLKHVFAKHSTPHNIVSNQGKLFVSKFWSSLCHLLDIKVNLSTTYHPETDRQTEHVNQILKQYIHLYINYQQDNWVSLLPLAEFAYNNTPHSATQVTPFFANKGYHPRFEIGIDDVSSYTARQHADDLTALHDYLKEQLRITIEQYTWAMEHRRILPLDFHISSKVWLDTCNIKTKCPSKKLDSKYVRPLTITQKISDHAYRLELPLAMKTLHDVFPVKLLQLHIEDEIPHCWQPPPPLVD